MSEWTLPLSLSFPLILRPALYSRTQFDLFVCVYGCLSQTNALNYSYTVCTSEWPKTQNAPLHRQRAESGLRPRVNSRWKISQAPRSDDRFCQLPLTLCRWKKRTKSRSPSIKITTERNLAFCTKHVQKSLWKGKTSAFAKERDVVKIGINFCKK